MSDWLDDVRNAISTKLSVGVERGLNAMTGGAIEKAAQVSAQAFPGQEWDGSQRNALRHSLWVGLMAKKLGAGTDNPLWSPVASTIAKGVAGFNELTPFMQDITGRIEPSQKVDSLLDMNNNAVGASVAAKTSSEDQLIDVLRSMATASKPAAQPPGWFDDADEQLLHDPAVVAPKRRNQW